MPKDRLLFVKEGRARYISHLDLMRTFQRAFLRADIPIKHTEGFNPHPFISIALPLSLGFASQCEILEFGLLEGVEHTQVPQRLNAALPEGVRVRECYPGERTMKELAWVDYRILMELDGDPQRLRQSWSQLLNRESWVVQKPSKKAKSGAVEVDIPKLVKEFSFIGQSESGFEMRVTLGAQNPGLNPSVMVNALMGACPELQPTILLYERMDVLDGDGKTFR